MTEEAVITGEIVAYKSLKDSTVRVTIDLATELESTKFHEAFRCGNLVAIARLKDPDEP